MNKQDRAMYLVNLITIMDSKDSTGRPKGSRLVAEYEKHYDLLMKEIEKGDEDETRKRT